ncbi:hypothetical protein TSO221_22610 [Azospirillum sp. TSO22-1]|nr:hypothetical protein TSO221_22610 [Azospirillum sp. TSO22-1]
MAFVLMFLAVIVPIEHIISSDIKDFKAPSDDAMEEIDYMLRFVILHILGIKTPYMPDKETVYLSL